MQFKLETKRKGIAEKAYGSLKSNGSDFVIANALEDLKPGYKAFLVDKNKKIINIGSKVSLVNVLNRVIKLSRS